MPGLMLTPTEKQQKSNEWKRVGQKPTFFYFFRQKENSPIFNKEL